MNNKTILTDDLSLIEQLREYAADNGYSHNDYADTMSMAADALERHEKAALQSPEIQRLKNIETIAKEVVSMSDGDGNYLVLTADIDRLRAAMEQQA